MTIKCHCKWSSQSTLDNINPRFGLVESTDLDNGSYFTAHRPQMELSYPMTFPVPQEELKG
jgi:hypothetical protein